MLTAERFTDVVSDELAAIRQERTPLGTGAGHLDDAATLFVSLSLSEQCASFLTLPAYDQLVQVSTH